MDMFNLPSLPHQRRSTMMICDFIKDFYIPDGKNSKMSQIINKWVFDKHLMVMKMLGSKYPTYNVHTVLGTMSLTQLMVILMLSTIIKSNQQIILPISVYLISGSWSFMYVGLQTITAVKMTPGWMRRGGRYSRRRLQPHHSQPNQDHQDHSMNWGTWLTRDRYSA